MILRARRDFDLIVVPISQRVGGRRGSLFQDIRGEHSSGFGVVGLEEFDDTSDDDLHRSFVKITFSS